MLSVKSNFTIFVSFISITGMKATLRTFVAAALLLYASPAAGQIYGKLNSIFALAGVINPQVEITLSDKMTFQAEIIFSPWKHISWKENDYPMLFFMASNDIRWFFRAPADGWYVGCNYGAQGFNMTKPEIFNKNIQFADHWGKGWGINTGVMVGWQRSLGQRWLLDAYLSFGYQISWYNSYRFDSGIELYPQGHSPDVPPDPWNASAEWGPNKAGVSFGYLLFDPKNKR